MKNKKIKNFSILGASVLITSNFLPLLAHAESTTKDSIGSVDMEDDGVTIGVDETQKKKTTYNNEIKEDGKSKSDVYVSQSSTFGVFIPKVIILDGKKNEEGINKGYYVVKVSNESNIGGKEFIKVIPENEFQLSQVGKNNIDAIVLQDKVEWFCNETNVLGNGEISTTNMSAGSWSGKFNFNINLANYKRFTLTNSNRDYANILLKGDIIIPEYFDYNGTKYKTVGVEYLQQFGTNSNVTSVVLPNSLERIGSNAFLGFINMGNVDIPDKVTEIGNMAFYNCQSITKIEIPTNVKKIGFECFNGCTNLSEITIPENCKDFGGNAFLNTAWIENQRNLRDDKIVIVNNVLIDGLETSGNVEVPNGVEKIITSTFYNNKNITSLTIPESTTSIEQQLFYECENLSTIIVDENNPKYDSRNNCNAIIETKTNTLHSGCKNTTIPNTITKIGDMAFYYTKGLVSINIPTSVTEIGAYAFYGCKSLTNLTIPNTVTKIGDMAFESCTSLTSITWNGKTYTDKTEFNQDIRNAGIANSNVWR